VRVRLDSGDDRATIWLGDDRQSYEHGNTYLVLALVFVMVRPASEVLPEALLAQAEPE